MDLRKNVLTKINEIGVRDASRFFGVSVGTISNWKNGNTSPTIDAAQLVVPETTPVSSIDEEAPTSWEGRRVMVMLPCYRQFNPKTHYTLFANYAKYGPEKIGMEMKDRTLIHEGRSILIDRGMSNKDAKAFIQFDDDMILPCGMPNLLNGRYNAKLPDELAKQVTISRLMSHPDDIGIVGVTYFGRSESGRAQCASAFQSDEENRKFHNLEYRGLKKEDWVATGGIRIMRWVIEEMNKAIEGGKWPECKREDKKSWYGYFHPSRVRSGEDTSFCRRAAEIGIQTYVDASLVCGHADGNHIFWAHNTRQGL